MSDEEQPLDYKIPDSEAEKLIQEYLDNPITCSWEFDPDVDIVGDVQKTIDEAFKGFRGPHAKKEGT